MLGRASSASWTRLERRTKSKQPDQPTPDPAGPWSRRARVSQEAIPVELI
jgi:hypothetical protein